MSASFPLSFDLNIRGAETVRERMREINDQFRQGQISTTQYTKGLREVLRDTNTFNRSVDVQRRLFFALHPALNLTIRGMSQLASVARIGIGIIQSLNIAKLTTTEKEEERRDVIKDIQDLEFQLEELAKKGLEDSSQFVEKAEELRKKKQELLSIEGQINEQLVQNKINLGLNILQLGEAVSQVALLYFIFKQLGGLAAVPAGLVSFFGALARNLPIIGPILPNVVDAIIKLIDHLSKGTLPKGGIFDLFDPEKRAKMLQGLTQEVQAIIKFFTEDIPDAIGLAGRIIGKFFIEDIPAMANFAAKNIIAFFKFGIDTVTQAIANFVSTAINLFSDLGRGIVDELIGPFQFILDQLALIRQAIEFVLSLGGAITSVSISPPPRRSRGSSQAARRGGFGGVPGGGAGLGPGGGSISHQPLIPLQSAMTNPVLFKLPTPILAHPGEVLGPAGYGATNIFIDKIIGTDRKTAKEFAEMVSDYMARKALKMDRTL